MKSTYFQTAPALCVIFGVIFLCGCVSGVTIYLEESCEDNHELVYKLRGTGEVRVRRGHSYFPGKNCSLRLTSPNYIVVSVKNIDFRPGCHDYLKISDETRQVGLCGSKNEVDTNMQYFGKTICINYVSEKSVQEILDYTGFQLTFTTSSSSKKDQSCDNRYDFKCHNGFCLNKKYICDGVNNCGDFSDEQKCGAGGPVIIIAMFLVSIIGIVGGFCISMGLVAAFLDFMKIKQNRREEGSSQCAVTATQICFACC